MTPLQKQILLKEEQRQAEAERKQMNGDANQPSGALNARHSSNGYTEQIHFSNSGEHETENQATFVE